MVRTKTKDLVLKCVMFTFDSVYILTDLWLYLVKFLPAILEVSYFGMEVEVLERSYMSCLGNIISRYNSR